MASIHISIVSHLQAPLVSVLLADIAARCKPHVAAITVLCNLPEPTPAVPADIAHLVDIVTNDRPLGFGANHNRNFRRHEASHFCVMNPDLRLAEDPFPELLRRLDDPGVALVGPLVGNPEGEIEDSARRMPTPLQIATRVLHGSEGPDYDWRGGPQPVDWVAGMFMLMRSDCFRAVGGFDERYFLYLEDVDLCTRIRLTGQRVLWVPSARVMHDARRSSHRLGRHLLWHVQSMMRFFASAPYRSARARAVDQPRA